MLVLTRKPGQAIEIAGGITIVVTQIMPGRVKLGIIAPAHIDVVRSEISTARHDPQETNPAPAA